MTSLPVSTRLMHVDYPLVVVVGLHQMHPPFDLRDEIRRIADDFDNSPNRLFIGGPMDGTFHPVHRDAMRFRVWDPFTRLGCNYRLQADGTMIYEGQP